MTAGTWYILDDSHNLVRASLHEWSEFMGQIERRRVGFTEIEGLRISTVFLGLDHGSYLGISPQWFETMVFGGEDYTERFGARRYETWSQAERGHAAMVEEVRAWAALRLRVENPVDMLREGIDN